MPPELLISVRDAAEAVVAIECGVDIIDIKEPARGALGRADSLTVVDIVRRVESHPHDGRPPVTMALGELTDLYVDPIEIPAGVSAVKLGLAGCLDRLTWRGDWAALKFQCEGVNSDPDWVAVVYADQRLAQSPSASDVIEAGAELGCRGVLIDTCSKSAGRLWDFVDVETLQTWIDAIHHHDIFAAVAGSLRLGDLEQLSEVDVDVVAVRGGVCDAGRQSTIDARRLNEFRQEMTAAWPKRPSSDATQPIGYGPDILSLARHRLVTARGRQ